MRFNKPRYVDRFLKYSEEVKLNSGENICIYSIADGLTEEEKNEWAKHILAHYINEAEIENSATINHLKKADYIRERVLPSIEGKSAMHVSGNFGEIVFCDFLEFVLGYEVPRYKLYGVYPGDEPKGIDIIAYKLNEQNNADDTIVYGEIKSRLAEKDCAKLQDAINDAKKRTHKDIALAFDSARRKLNQLRNIDEAEIIQRFCDSEKPCKRIKNAGLITKATAFTNNDFIGVNIETGNVIEVHIIHAAELWELAKDLWRRACL